MQSQLRDVINACSALLDQADELGNLTAEIDKAKAVLDATKAEHASVQAKLNDDWSLLEQRQHAALAAHDKAIWEKTAQLRQLGTQADTARANLAGLQAALTATKSEYDSIQASLAEIKRRFAR
jgi:chromosome segregation ATPase